MRLTPLFLLVIIFIACTRDTLDIPDSTPQQKTNITESLDRPQALPESVGGTLINTEQGDFGPFKIGSWWIYRTMTVTCEDVAPFECDTLAWTENIALTKDTIIENRRYLGGDGDWFFMENGKYFKRSYGHQDYKNGFLEILYLDVNKSEGESWIDTADIPGFPADPNAKHVFHHEITYESDSLIGVTTREELIINGQPNSGGYPKSRLYKKGVGLYDRSEFLDWGTYSFEITDYHVVR